MQLGICVHAELWHSMSVCEFQSKSLKTSDVLSVRFIKSGFVHALQVQFCLLFYLFPWDF